MFPSGYFMWLQQQKEYQFFLLKNTLVELDKYLFHPSSAKGEYMVPLYRCHLASGIPITPSMGKKVTNHLLRQSLWLTPSWFLRLHAGNHPKGKNPQEKSPLRQSLKLTAEPKKSLSIQYLPPFSTFFNARGPCYVPFLNNTTSIQALSFSLFIN